MDFRIELPMPDQKEEFLSLAKLISDHPIPAPTAHMLEIFQVPPCTPKQDNGSATATLAYLISLS